MTKTALNRPEEPRHLQGPYSLERLDILGINEQLMLEPGGSWIDPPPPKRQLALVDHLGGRVKDGFQALLAEAGGRPVALKDSRLAVLLPLCAPVLDSMLHPVLVVRDRLEVAISLARRGGTPIPLALASWEIHLV